MKTPEIKQETIDKCLIVLRKMKYRADNNLPMNLKTIFNKVHTNRAIPGAAKSLNYFKQGTVNKWICLKLRFDPIDARHVLNYIYTYYPKTNKEDGLDEIEKVRVKIQDNLNEFIPPTIQQIKDYCKLKDIDIDVKHFHSYYESVGWIVGKKKMVSWKAAICTWERSKYNIRFVKGKINEYSDKELINEVKKRGLIVSIDKYTDEELSNELKKRGYSGSLNKEVLF